MADRIALWGRDIDESSADADNGDVSNVVHDPITEPIPVVEADYADSDDLEVQSSQLEKDHRAVSYAEPLAVRDSVSAGSTLTFKPAPAPWYRTRRGLIVLIAVIAIAVVLALLPMLLRSPAPGTEDSTNVTPTTAPPPASSTVQPTTTSVAPTLSSRPVPPPTPPPAPPPAQEAPVYTRQYQPPSYSEPEQSKPEIGVTRAPISVAPKPVTPPTSADVGADGDNPRRSRW